jgi:transformer-2 protein
MGSYRRSYSRSSSNERRKKRSPSYERHRHRHDRHDRKYRSPRRSPRNGGISNPPPDHPEANEGNNVYIANLSPETKESELKDLFGKHGSIKDVRIVRDPFTKESRGFGFVTFENSDNATEAVKEINDTEVNGRKIRAEKARRSKPHQPTPGSYCGPAGASSKYRLASKYRRRSPPSPISHRRSRSPR